MGQGDQGLRHRGKLIVRATWGILGLILLASLAVAPTAVAQQKKAQGKGPPPKVEKLACKLGTEDQHARIAVELLGGQVRSFAYYSIWKPRTCSVHVERGDAYSKWENFGNTTTVMLIEEKGAFLIDRERNQYHFIFRDVDRMRYCGMEGKINGSLTVSQGRSACVVQGVMDGHEG